MEERSIYDILKEDGEDDSSLYLDISHLYDGDLSTPVGNVKKIKTTLCFKDKLQNCHARWNIKRNSFRVPIGLYAIGNPNEESPVLVTANYKLTLDHLRKELENQNLWLLVIDTKGVNVWCAAGKGTFGTEEIIRRVVKSKLKKIVSHRKIVLPQLGAPGVEAHIVKKYTGFNVVYGPIRAKDIPVFLENGYKVTSDMRKVTFSLKERIVLTPIELLLTLKYVPIIFVILFAINWIGNPTLSFQGIFAISWFNSLSYVIAILIGTILVPILLPYIPFRSFSLKGVVMGILWSFVTYKLNNVFMFADNWFSSIGNLLVLTSIVTMLSLNFTGSTTYTSFSGVQKETIRTVPIIALASIIGLGLLIAGKVIG